MVDGEEAVPGVVFGLAYAQGGMGGILPIEVNQMPGRGRLRLTGMHRMDMHFINTQGILL